MASARDPRRGGAASVPFPPLLVVGLLLPTILAVLAESSPLAAQSRDTLGAGGHTVGADVLRRGGGTPEVADTVGRRVTDTLTLQDALRTALGESPEIRGQQARASAAEAARWADWGAFLPTASANASFSRNDFTRTTFESEEGVASSADSVITSVSKLASQALRFDWNVLQGGRAIAEFQAGDADVEAERLRLSETERRVVSEVKQAFFEARKQERLVDIARRQLESRRRELEQTRQRYRIAAVDRADLLGARVEVRQAEVRLLDRRDAARTARRALGVAMGAGEDAVGGDVRLADLGPAPDPGNLSRDRLARRAAGSHPEIRALEAEADRASARVWGARSRYLPDVSLGFSLSRSESFGPSGPFLELDPDDTSSRFSLSASWNLFDGFRRREETARASAELQGARAERARRRLEIEKTVRDLADEVERRDRRLELLRKQLQVAEERVELLSEQYRLGSAGFAELQRAIEDVTRAEQDVVRERYDYLGAWARLERWAGDVAPALPSPTASGAADAGGTSSPSQGRARAGAGESEGGEAGDRPDAR